MCFPLTINTKIKRAGPKGVTCYKVVYNHGAGEYRSCHKEFTYNSGEDYTHVGGKTFHPKPMEMPTGTSGWNKYAEITHEGFHSYKSLKDARNIRRISLGDRSKVRVIQCLIPAGTEYLVGPGNTTIGDSNVIEYVSRAIKVLGQPQNLKTK